MKHKNFAILLGCTVTAKAAAVIYRILLVNILGAGGIGTLQLALPFYTFAVTLLSGGIGAVIARTVSARQDCIEGDFETFTNTCCLFFAVAGVIIGIAIAIGSPRICRLIGNADAAIPLACLTPSLVFCPISACIKGYFQGMGKMSPTSASILIEQGAKLAFSTLLSLFLSARSSTLAIIGASLGITVSEVVVCVYLVVLYLKKRAHRGSLKPSALFKRLKIVLASTGSVILIPLSQLADSFIIVNMLTPQYSVTEATAMYGLLCGPVSSVINIPSVITGAVTTYILPRIGASDEKAVRMRYCGLIRLCVLACGIFTASVIIFAPTVISILYPTLTAAQKLMGSHLLRICAAECIFVCVMRVTSVHLQGLGDFTTPTVALFGGIIIKVLLTVILSKPLSIYGCATASVCGYAFSFVYGLMVLRKRISFDFSTKNVISTICCFVLYTCIAFGIYYLFPTVYGAIAALLISAAVLCAFIKTFNIINLRKLY